MGCNECDSCCCKEKEKIKSMASSLEKPIVAMNQQTYEAITGDSLVLDGVPVMIDPNMKDRSYLVLERWHDRQISNDR